MEGTEEKMPKDEEEAMALPVSRLRSLLQARRIDYRDCIEKRDLVLRLLQVPPTSAETTSSSASQTSTSSSTTTPAGETRKYAKKYGDLDCVVLENSPDPQWIFVIIHGYGANNEDLVPIARECLTFLRTLTPTPRIRFIHPNAHKSMEQMGGGRNNRMWWPIDMNALLLSFLSGMVQKTVPEGLEEARTHIMALIKEALSEANLPVSRLIVGGFSQGGILSTDIALRLEENPAALCILSGVLLCEDQWKPLMPKRKGLRVLQSHGQSDQLLPQPLGLALRKALTEAGAEVEFIDFSGGHTVPPASIKALFKLLATVTSSVT